MIREEFRFEDIKDYLFTEIDLLISGKPSQEERSHFFYDKWSSLKKDVLRISFLGNSNLTEFEYISNGKSTQLYQKDLIIELPRILNILMVKNKNVLVDISSLNHVLIMFLTRTLLKHVKPKTFFAAYIRPLKYKGSKDEFKFTLTSKISGIKSVPGFAKRENSSQTLCAFLGFEGVRLNGIIESVNDIKNTFAIVAFPSGNPQWFNVTMWNSMDLLSDNHLNYTVCNCFSESIFETVSLLNNILGREEHIVLAPIGTRAHSMASAIFACQHNNVKIVYDYAVESEDRSEGISDINVYHLTSFIET